MYELASGKPCVVNFTTDTIIAFNSAIKSVRNINYSNEDEVKLAILFGYTHDPLNFGDPTKYGDIRHIYKVFACYRHWCLTMKIQDTPMHWKRKKILETMRIETSDLLTQHLKELVGAL